MTAVAPTGAYRGCVLDGTGVRRWLGIPFIKNPYEPVRRYLKPEPYGAHEGVMDCLKHGSIPLQPNPDKNVEKKMVGGDGPLCLNIWAPKAGENLLPSWSGCRAADRSAVPRTTNVSTARTSPVTASCSSPSPTA